MNLTQFEDRFLRLGVNYKTKDLDKFNRTLIKEKVDVACLRDVVLEKQQYHRTFFQVSLAQLDGIEAKFAFIEQNFDKLQDWWHVDQLSQFVDKQLTLDFACKKAIEYVKNPLTFARRWGYVMFMPTLVKDKKATEKIFPLFKNDNQYFVQMAEAWLISYLAIYAPQETLNWLKNCNLKYNIVGKAIQKICDSFRVSDEYKALFKEIRKKYKK